MKYKIFSLIIFLLNFLKLSSLVAEVATVTITSPEKIVSATGLAITPNGVTEKNDVVIKKTEDNKWLISFDTGTASSETLLVTALGTTESGNTIFSPTISITKNQSPTTKNVSCINSQITSLRQSQIGYIKALITNRLQQRHFAKNSIEKILDSESSILNEITKLEINLGLYPGYQISQEENSFELLARCFRLLSALKLLETRRQNLVTEAK